MRSLFYFILVTVSSFSFAQGLSIKFLESTFDFKKVEEAGGEVSHTFQFINMGMSPVAIVSVNADCGCTTPSWTEETLQPGDSGSVLAAYDPYDQPGKFDKKLTVKFTNGEESVLKLSGIVLPRVKSNAEEEFPEVMGCLLFKSNYIHLAKITDNEKKERRIQFYNNCDTNVVIDKSLIVVPEHIAFELNTTTIDPKSYAAATVFYDPLKKGELGYSRDDIFFATNEDTLSEKRLVLTGEVQHYFPKMTDEELALQPKARFDTLVYEYGTKPLDSKVSFSFSFYNDGSKDLEILEVKTACKCVSAEVPKKKIEKGEKGTIDVIFDGKDRTGRQVKTVIVYTNDPKNPIVPLKVSGKLN